MVRTTEKDKDRFIKYLEGGNILGKSDNFVKWNYLEKVRTLLASKAIVTDEDILIEDSVLYFVG